MALATARQNGAPAVRYVLLRGIDARGFVFYTDARSRKGGELRSNPRAALALYWNAIGKQARIEGRVERSSPSSRTPTVARATAASAWRRSPRRRALHSPSAPISSIVFGGCARSTGRRRFLDRRAGPDSGSCRARSSSGRIAPTGSIIASSSSFAAAPGGVGCFSREAWAAPRRHRPHASPGVLLDRDERLDLLRRRARTLCGREVGSDSRREKTFRLAAVRQRRWDHAKRLEVSGAEIGGRRSGVQPHGQRTRRLIDRRHDREPTASTAAFDHLVNAVDR